MEKISCGIILHDGTKFLVGHVTRTHDWSIPKGLKEENESFLETAIREFKEETNMDIQKYRQKIKLLGEYKTREKRIIVFHLKMRRLPRLRTFYCFSVAERDGVSLGFPEIDSFDYARFERIKHNIHKELYKLIQSNKRKLKEEDDGNNEVSS